MKFSNNNNRRRLRRSWDADADTDTALCPLAFFKALSPVLVAGRTVFFLLLLGTTATISMLVIKRADLRQPLCFTLPLMLMLFKRLDRFAIFVGRRHCSNNSL